MGKELLHGGVYVCRAVESSSDPQRSIPSGKLPSFNIYFIFKAMPVFEGAVRCKLSSSVLDSPGADLTIP